MDKLRDLALQIETLYEDMSITFHEYQHRRQLSCRPGCGKCCLSPNVFTSTLEMLPLAFHLLDTHQAEQTLDQLEQHQENFCVFYRLTSEDGAEGFCSAYAHRPSICRMFGAAGYPDKHGKPGLSTCAVIKADHPQEYSQTLIAIQQDDPAPMMKDWRSQITAISYDLATKDMPINEAAKDALSRVLLIASLGYEEINPILPAGNG